MAELFIPTLHYLKNENLFTGSSGLLRFRIEPQIPKDEKKKPIFDDSARLFCWVWHGEKCFELSEIELERDFPLTEEGRAELKNWLESMT